MSTEQIDIPDYEFEPVTREYTETLREAMRSHAEWQKHLDPKRIRRTQAGLEEMVMTIENQIAVHGEPSEPGFNPDWLRRAEGMLRVTQTRLNRVNSLVDGGGVMRKDYLKVVEEISRYKDFAWELAVELEKCGPKGIAALCDIQAPHGGITAFDWLERRAEMIERTESSREQGEVL